MTFPKPTKATRSRRTRPSLAEFYAYAASHTSCVSRQTPVQLNHLHGLSLKTRKQAPRKSGHTRAIVAPMTPAEHDRYHEVGEAAFEAENGLPSGYLKDFAAALMAAYITGEE